MGRTSTINLRQDTTMIHVATFGSFAIAVLCASIPLSADETKRPSIQADVDVVFGEKSYTFSQAEAAKEVKIEYDIVVKQSVPGIITFCQDDGGCSSPGPSGLIRFERLYGGKQLYGLFDVGLCPPRVAKPVTLNEGKHHHIFLWDGRNWRGPSDTCSPKGKPFPPGEYTLEISFRGKDTTAKGEQAFHIRKTVKVVITK